ncbi:F-box protein [Cardamine amara subsp. amara]|uniref:F-box protein n=1 Tax=Cardamine amara subsp. amara TaxID=228776 RepID=A0ABD1B6N5_CARAN
MLNLVLKDNIRASAVCKSWLEAVLSVRIVDKSPWLMHFSKQSNLCELYDPLQRKMCELELPELANSKLINIPRLELSYQAIAFSCAPSNTCLLLALKPIDRGVALSTCNLGATQWITKNYPCWPPFESSFHSNLLYSNGCFYGLYGKGNFFCFNPTKRIWYLLTQPSLTKCHFGHKTEMSKIMFLAEHKGLIFGLFAYGNEKPSVYKLDSSKWEETSNKLNGLTVFTSKFSTETRIDLPWIRNNVHFSNVPFDRKHYVYYSFDEERYYQHKEHLQPQHHPYLVYGINIKSDVLRVALKIISYGC